MSQRLLWVTTLFYIHSFINLTNKCLARIETLLVLYNTIESRIIVLVQCQLLSGLEPRKLWVSPDCGAGLGCKPYRSRSKLVNTNLVLYIGVMHACQGYHVVGMLHLL